MSQDPHQPLTNDGVNFVKTQHHDTYPAIDPTKANLSGKHVLITGASKGVGKATALSYARAGASGIALAARSSTASAIPDLKAAAKESGHPEPKILSLSLDVTDRKSVEAAAQIVSEEFSGKLDILINNAGYLAEFVKLMDTDPDEWWKEWDVNIKGVYFVTRAFLPLVLASDAKTIVNVSSIGALILMDGASGYQGSKFALLRFTEFLMTDYGDRGLLAYAIHPGALKTELASNIPEEMLHILVDEPELPADGLVWLTKERREWLAGRYVSVNWDVEELERKKEDILKGDLLKMRLAVNLF